MIFLTESTVKATASDIESASASIDLVRGRKELGFLKTPERLHLWESSQNRALELRKKFDTLVVLGIGGSAMGGKTIKEIFETPDSQYKIDFIDNIDSHGFWKKITAIKNLKKTHWVIVSKSGNTLETLAMANYLNQYLAEKGIELKNVSTAISEPQENILTKWAKKNDVPILEIPVDVGGRFSVLSPVGLLPAAFLGVNLEEMRQGALWAANEKELSANLVALSFESFRREEWITCFWSYCDSLEKFGSWVQQLWAESLAKKTTRQGLPAPRASTPLPLVGSRDQHSVLQQIAEGQRDKFIWFIRVAESEDHGPNLNKDIFGADVKYENKNLGRVFAALAVSTAQGLKQVGVNSLTLRLGQLHAKEVGALFMIFQVVVAALGEHMKINAFDQPGVELGKRLAKDILKN